MNNIKLTKSNIILTILFISSVIMLPMEYYWGTSGMEFLAMEKSYFMMSGLLLWVFFIAQSVSVIFGFIDRYDFALFASVIGACGAFLAVLVLFADRFDGGFWEDLGTGILYCIIAIAEIFTCLKKKKEAG